MGKGSSKQPAAPDAYETAKAESQFNRIDTFGPSGGGVRHGYTDKDGNFQQGVAPKGFQSAQQTVENDFQRDLRSMMEPAAQSLTGQIIQDNVVGLPGRPSVTDRSDVAQDIFSRNFSLMAPGIDRANSRLLTNLQARGIPIGSDAFDEAYSEQQRTTQDTISRLAQDANIAAGQEQTRQFNLESAERGSALNEIAALMGQGFQPVSATPSGQAAPVNYAGSVQASHNAAVSGANANAQANAATAGALGSIGGAAILKCSMDYKEISHALDLVACDDAITRMPLAVWQYKPEHRPVGDDGRVHVGPMAEHFSQLTGLGDGRTIDAVDAIGVLMGALQSALLRIEALEFEAAGGRFQ